MLTENKKQLTMRERIYNLIGKVENVDKLMRDKVKPYVLIEELPIPVMVGEKVIYVGNLNLENEDYFFLNYAKILGNLGLQNLFMDLMSNGEMLWKYTKIHKKLRKQLTKLIYTTLLKQQRWYYPKNRKQYKLNKCSYRYFKNHISKESLLQMMFLIWLYNYDSLGKSLPILANRVGVEEISQTYMHSWLANCPGVNGNFLLDQLPNLDWFNKDMQTPDEKEHVEVNEK